MKAASVPSSRVLAIVTPVCVAGVIALGAAILTWAQGSHSTADEISVATLFVAMILVERFPVPVEGVDAGGVTLGFVLVVATIILFGWQAGLFVAAGGATVTHLIGHRPLLRVAYNRAMFALASLVAGLAIRPIEGQSVGSLILRVALCAFLYNWVVNLTLISLVLSASSGKQFRKLFRDNAKQTTAPFALMASAALMLVVMWQ